jgi:hypothetical protein
MVEAKSIIAAVSGRVALYSRSLTGAWTFQLPLWQRLHLNAQLVDNTRNKTLIKARISNFTHQSSDIKSEGSVQAEAY